jgi:hypothetical protein
MSIGNGIPFLGLKHKNNIVTKNTGTCWEEIDMTLLGINVAARVGPRAK